MEDGANDVTEITHEPYCDKIAHTDPAADCASKTVDTHGLISHVARTAEGLRAFVEPRSMVPLTLTSAACADLRNLFGHLEHLLAHH